MFNPIKSISSLTWATKPLHTPHKLTSSVRQLATTRFLQNQVSTQFSWNKPISVIYLDQMIKPARERRETYNRMELMLGTSNNSLNPVKVTSLVDHKLLEKISREGLLDEFEQRKLDVEYRLLFKLGKKAEKLEKTIHIDLEFPHQNKAIFYLAKELMKKFNTERPTVYATVHAADKGSLTMIRDIVANPSIKYPAVRLERGSYYADWAKDTEFVDRYNTSEQEIEASYKTITQLCSDLKVELWKS